MKPFYLCKMEKLWIMAQTYVLFNWKYGGTYVCLESVAIFHLETNIATYAIYATC